MAGAGFAVAEDVNESCNGGSSPVEPGKSLSMFTTRRIVHAICTASFTA